MPTFKEIEAQLTAPGALFETCQEDVLGQSMTVFKNRKSSLRELLADSAAHGDKEYLALGERRISYADHLGLVGSTARALAEQHGIAKGDRVAIFAENWPEWVVTYWATVSLGGIVAALNGWWTPAEVKHGIELSKPKLLIGDRKRLARAEALGLDVPTLEIEELCRLPRGSQTPNVTGVDGRRQKNRPTGRRHKKTLASRSGIPIPATVLSSD